MSATVWFCCHRHAGVLAFALQLEARSRTVYVAVGWLLEPLASALAAVLLVAAFVPSSYVAGWALPGRRGGAAAERYLGTTAEGSVRGGVSGLGSWKLMLQPLLRMGRGQWGGGDEAEEAVEGERISAGRAL
jgi:hypothetical protein